MGVGVCSCMLHVVNSISDSYISLLRDDPVRPEISVEFRCTSPNNYVFVLLSSDSTVEAVLCCSLRSSVPNSVSELLELDGSVFDTAVFYTVWSYVRGGGRRIIPEVVLWLRVHFPQVVNFYTLSPLGEKVRDFHYSLGARLHRENIGSVNYRYFI